VAWATGRMKELVAVGATGVELVVMGRQHDAASAELGASPTAPSDEELAAICAAAAAMGLEVVLLPIIELEELGQGDWRGTLHPADRDRWWASYERFVLRYAALAATAHVGWFSVGSELGSTEGWRDRWIHLIAAVRRVFGGKLLYSANWDRYREVPFWSRLDAIGVSSYFAVAATAADELPAMALRWRRVLDELARFASASQRPLVLTEVGTPSRDGAATAPWDYTRAGEVDLEEQRRVFAALAAAWPHESVDGAMIWEVASDGGSTDAGYSPRGKPAWCVLARWWHGPLPCPP
jgi:hypothetical protein